MANMTIRKAKDLEVPAREWLQRLFGRPLDGEEQVTILVFPPHPAPPVRERQEAFGRVERILDRPSVRLESLTYVPAQCPKRST